MATINKKLIHFRSLSDFEARLAAGDVLSTSIVWIKDAKKIWTHGEYYDCNGGGDNVYVFNPEGVASEEYAGLQDAVNNGKMVAINMDGLTAPCILIPSESGIIVQVELAMSNTQESGASSYMLTFNSMSYLVTEDGIALYNSGTAILGGGDGTQVLTNSASYSSLKTINGESILGRGNIAIEGGETLTEADILAMGFTKNAGTITGVSANGTSVATSGVANIPAASTSKYGVTKLSSSTSSTSTSLAATASAVKAAYDLANGKQATLVSGTNIKTVNGQSLLGSGDITISGGGSYVPMPESNNGPTSSANVEPNTSVIVENWFGANIYLQSPTDTSVVNTYSIVLKTFAMGLPITIDKNIIWANGNAPVLDDSTSEIIEMNIKYLEDSDSNIQYLGTWAKYTV